MITQQNLHLLNANFANQKIAYLLYNLGLVLSEKENVVLPEINYDLLAPRFAK